MPCLAQQLPGSSPPAGFSADIAGIRPGMAPQQAAVAVRAANLIAALREKYGPEAGSATAPGVTGPPGLVLELVVKAVNMNLYRAHYEASEKFLRQAEAANVNKQQEKANQVKPKL